MEMLKVFTQGIFGIKNAERKFYGFIIQEFQYERTIEIIITIKAINVTPFSSIL